MTVFWHYYWPVMTLGLVIGAITGMFLYNRLVVSARDRLAGLDVAIDDKRRTRRNIMLAGLATTLALTALWHGPIGAGDRLSGTIEAAASAAIKRQEMVGVTARLERSPLRRRIVLSGAADDFQRRGLVRIIDDIPGVSGVRWASPPGPAVEMVK